LSSIKLIHKCNNGVQISNAQLKDASAGRKRCKQLMHACCYSFATRHSTFSAVHAVLASLTSFELCCRSSDTQVHLLINFIMDTSFYLFSNSCSECYITI